jgi:hypothetical protein
VDHPRNVHINILSSQVPPSTRHPGGDCNAACLQPQHLKQLFTAKPQCSPPRPPTTIRDAYANETPFCDRDDPRSHRKKIKYYNSQRAAAVALARAGRRRKSRPSVNGPWAYCRSPPSRVVHSTDDGSGITASASATSAAARAGCRRDWRRLRRAAAKREKATAGKHRPITRPAWRWLSATRITVATATTTATASSISISISISIICSNYSTRWRRLSVRDPAS